LQDPIEQRQLLFCCTPANLTDKDDSQTDQEEQETKQRCQ